MNKILIADSQTSFDDFKALLQGSPQPYLLLRERSQQALDEEITKACEALREDPDLAAIGYYQEELEPWDVGEFTDFDGIIMRASSLRELLESGYRPLYSNFEFPQALRLAGWRVQAWRKPLVCGPRLRGAFHQGRLRKACELYDLAIEQILARGPRLLKKTWAYALSQGWKSLRNGQSPVEVAGAIWQALLASLNRSQDKVARGAWRKSRLALTFPEVREAPRAVLLFTALRPWYLRRALGALHRFWPQDSKTMLIVSQDGPERATQNMIESLGESVTHYRFTKAVNVPLRDLLKGWTPYYRIAHHYGYALHRVFAEKSIQEVIILEDDLEVGPDFFNYLDHCRSFLKDHSDLLAASAWNDHGMLAEDPLAIHRTDCFPGYGWLLTREAWESIAEQWPATLWDEWIREPAVLAGRQFLRPELSRVRNFGRSGTGSSQFFDQYIAPVKLQGRVTPFPQVRPDFSLSSYRTRLIHEIRQCKRLESLRDRGQQDAYLLYRGQSEFAELAEALGILPEFRPQAPRAAFEGVVSLRIEAHQLFLVPEGYLEAFSQTPEGL